MRWVKKGSGQIVLFVGHVNNCNLFDVKPLEDFKQGTEITRWDLEDYSDYSNRNGLEDDERIVGGHFDKPQRRFMSRHSSRAGEKCMAS